MLGIPSLMSLIGNTVFGKGLNRILLAVGGASLFVLYIVFRVKVGQRNRNTEQRLDAIIEKRRIDRAITNNVTGEDDLANLLSGRGYDRLH